MEDITVYVTETGAVLDYPEWMTEEEALVRVYAFLAGKAEGNRGGLRCAETA